MIALAVICTNLGNGMLYCTDDATGQVATCMYVSGMLVCQ